MTERGRLRAAAVLVLATSAPRPAPAAPGAGPLRVALICERRATPGRLVCELEAEVDSGRIAWADVVVRGAPDFASPLRDRVGLPEARLAT